jgi:DNA-binding helix-hairpin-helix protein with protein kinase domain
MPPSASDVSASVRPNPAAWASTWASAKQEVVIAVHAAESAPPALLIACPVVSVDYFTSTVSRRHDRVGRTLQAQETVTDATPSV